MQANCLLIEQVFVVVAGESYDVSESRTSYTSWLSVVCINPLCGRSADEPADGTETGKAIAARKSQMRVRAIKSRRMNSLSIRDFGWTKGPTTAV